MTISLDKRLTAQILKHLNDRMPEEGCGFLVEVEGKLEFHPVPNIHPKPLEYAYVHGSEWARMEDMGDVRAYVHSHPYGTTQASEADLTQVEAHGIPWLIVSLPAAGFAWYAPCGYTAPLLERPFVYGVHDCATLARDYHKQEMGISYEVKPTEWQWWKKEGLDLYIDNLPGCGFYKLKDSDDYRVGDVMMMQLESQVANHAAVYIGDDMILHHPFGHLSRRDVYSGTWMHITVSRWRHKDA